MTNDPAFFRSRYRITDKYIEDTNNTFADLLAKLDKIPAK